MTTETQQTAPYDPYAEADAAKPVSRHYFGYTQIDARAAVLVKGAPNGKVIFDPQVHSADQRVTALTIALTPLPRPGRDEYTVSRDLIVQSVEWTKIVKPSLDKLGTGLKAIHGRYAQIEFVELGQYTNKAGETKTRTMPRFLAIYQDEAECEAAANAFYSARNSGTAQQAAPVSAAPAGAAPVSDAEKAMAARFLPALFNSSKAGDPEKIVDRFIAAIAANSLTARYFSADSPEVVQIVMASLKPA